MPNLQLKNAVTLTWQVVLNLIKKADSIANVNLPSSPTGNHPNCKSRFFLIEGAGQRFEDRQVPFAGVRVRMRSKTSALRYYDIKDNLADTNLSSHPVLLFPSLQTFNSDI